MILDITKRIGVVGAGRWGSALAQTIAKAEQNVLLYGRNSKAMEKMEASRHFFHFPKIELSRKIECTSNISDLTACEVLLLVTPAQTTREMCKTLLESGVHPKVLILCAKGLELKTGQYLTEVVAHYFPKVPAAVLSGPSFASETIEGLPTAVTIGAESLKLAEQLCLLFHHKTFRPYGSNDRIGVELSGAVKNVLAIACGVAFGKGFGDNTKAALISRSFAELFRMGLKENAKPETLCGLSGLGDLVLTCSSEKSRNYSFGIKIGRGIPIQEMRRQTASHDSQEIKLTEGYFTAPTLVKKSRALKVDMPVVQAVANVLEGNLSVDEAVDALMSRPLSTELS